MRSSRSDPDPIDPGPAGFAHRGLHGPGAPENSLAAFRAAVAIGAGIECDVRLTADGEVMVHHDPDLRRMCGRDLVIERSRAEVIAGQRLSGTGEHVPWLAELLDLVDGRVPLLIELKTCEGNAERLAQAVAGDLSGYAGPVAVMGFDPRVGRWFARNIPYVRRGLLLRARTRAPRRWASVLATAPHFLGVERSALHLPWVARARRRRPVYGWTIRTALERRQAEVQADALIWEGDGRP